MAAAQRYSPATDMYAFGVLANELFAGERPWKGVVKEVEILMSVYVSRRRPALFVPATAEERLLLQLVGGSDSGCLHQDRAARPAAAVVYELLLQIAAPAGPVSVYDSMARRNPSLTRMTSEYRHYTSTAMVDLRPTARTVHGAVSGLFQDSVMSASFREKDGERAAQKDIRDYGGLESRRSQVTDLFAARLVPKRDKHTGADDETFRDECVSRIVKHFAQSHPDIDVQVHKNKAPLRVKAQGVVRVVRVVYIVFARHIELQVLSMEDYLLLEQGHEQYEEDRQAKAGEKSGGKSGVQCDCIHN
jgi:hypothetical protein